MTSDDDQQKPFKIGILSASSDEEIAAWHEENRDAIAAEAACVEKHGVPGAGLDAALRESVELSEHAAAFVEEKVRLFREGRLNLTEPMDAATLEALDAAGVVEAENEELLLSVVI